MESIPGPLLYKVLDYADVSSIGALELLSQKIANKLSASISGLQYLVRKRVFHDNVNSKGITELKELIRYFFTNASTFYVPRMDNEKLFLVEYITATYEVINKEITENAKQVAIDSRNRLGTKDVFQIKGSQMVYYIATSDSSRDSTTNTLIEMNKDTLEFKRITLPADMPSFNGVQSGLFAVDELSLYILCSNEQDLFQIWKLDKFTMEWSQIPLDAGVQFSVAAYTKHYIYLIQHDGSIHRFVLATESIDSSFNIAFPALANTEGNAKVKYAFLPKNNILTLVREEDYLHINLQTQEIEETNPLPNEARITVQILNLHAGVYNIYAGKYYTHTDHGALIITRMSNMEISYDFRPTRGCKLEELR